MRIQDVRPQAFVFQLRCDRCGVLAQHNMDIGFNNFLQIGFDAAWGSDIGDGTRVDIDLCHKCLKETLGLWLRFSTSAWNDLPASEHSALGAPEGEPPS